MKNKVKKKVVVSVSIMTMALCTLLGVTMVTKASNNSQTTVNVNDSNALKNVVQNTKSNNTIKSESNSLNENVLTKNLEFEITKVNEKKARTRAMKFAEYFSKQQFRMVVDMEVKDKEVNDALTEDVFKDLYNAYFIGNKYVCCSAFNYYGYSKSTDTHVIDVYIKGKLRINKIQLSFNKYWGMKGFFYYSYSEPIPENTFLYNEELVDIGEHKLKGLLTIPKTNEVRPVVILLQGSGYLNADSSIGENRIFADIAHKLAEEGVATLRYNERFNQCAELAVSNNTVYTEVIDDAVAAVKQMAVDNRIDKTKIFIAGHSLGGMVAPKVAEKCPEVKGLISLAGSPRRLVDILYDQELLTLAQINKYKAEKEQEKKDKTLSEDDYKEEMKYVQEIKNELKVNFNNIRIIRSITKDSDKVVEGFSESYWKSTNELNTEASIARIRIPMLIMQGSADVQVTERTDYVEWQRVLDGRSNCTFKVYPELNHLFMKTLGNPIFKIYEEYTTKGTVDENVIKDMAKFIKDKSGIKKNE